MKMPKINCSYAAMGFYTCIDENTYDGAEDSGKFARMIGTGKSKESAIADYYQQLSDYFAEEIEDCQPDFIYYDFCLAEKLADRIDNLSDARKENL